MKRSLGAIALVACVACSGDETNQANGALNADSGTGGASANGGSGNRGSGGARTTGGAAGRGTGGSAGASGDAGAGGSAGAGGNAGAGGSAGAGGTSGAGGNAGAGGISGAGGSTGTGGTDAGTEGGPIDAGPPVIVRFNNLQPESALAGDGDVIEYTLSLEQPAPSGGALITIEVLPSGGNMTLTAPTSVTVAAGETTATFSVTVHGVGAIAIRLIATNRRHAWIASPANVNSLVLSEALTNPVGLDPGNEAVEIYNGGSTPVDLSTYTLQAGSQTYNLVAALTGTLGPGECAAIPGLSGLPNSATTPGEPGNAIALFNGTTIVDAVLYGEQTSGGLPDETGTPGTIDSPSGAFTGLSLHRVGPNAWWTAPPSIGDCTLIGGRPPSDGGAPDASTPDASTPDAGADGGP